MKDSLNDENSTFSYLFFSFQGSFRKIHIWHSMTMAYIGCKFIRIRSTLKVILREEHSTSSAQSHITFFSWKSISGTRWQCPTRGVDWTKLKGSFHVKVSTSALYLIPFKGFSWKYIIGTPRKWYYKNCMFGRVRFSMKGSVHEEIRYFPENPYLALGDNDLQSLYVWKRLV